ncbi:FtsK/SpoIIIE domain-containing protein [Enterococcus hirae]
MNISLSILFDLFYFGEMFIHEVFTQNDKELVIAGKKICYIKQHINFSDSSIKDDPRFLILKHETLQRKWIDPPKQLIDISCATTSALMIESDAMIAIDYQDNNYQLSIYPSKAPVYYNQQLVTKGVFTFQVGDQIVVDQWIIERREKQWQIIGLGQAIQLNPWVLSEVPYIPEYPKHFPFFRRSPRIYLEEPKVQVEVRLPRHEAAQEKQSFFKLVLPSLGIFILSGMFLFFSNRNLLLILGMYGLNLLTSSISTINYLLNKKKIKRKKSEQKITIQQYRIKKAFELNRLQQRQKEVLQYMYPSNNQLARMTKECHPRIYERRPKDKDFFTVCLGIGERPSSFKIVSSYLDEDQWNDEILSDFIRPYQKLKNAPIAISDVGILVIDWKGGGLAQTVSKLPHFMGAITNLDRVGTSRALISIKAELEKRQRLLATYEVNNINEYMQLYKQRKQRNVSAYPDQPLPHLFLVSDEFAELKVNVPEFLEELTSVARIGRSLGVHLILATQKPAGVVNDQIEANSKSKVALKMASVQDSKELLQTTDAAYVSRPGRGYLKVGENDVYELFQSGYTKAPYAPNQSLEDERIVVVNEFGQKEVLFAPTEKDSRKAAGSIVTQYEAVRRLIVQTFQQSTFSQPSQPWLPELPTWLVMPIFKGNERNTLKVPIGLLDVPHEQKQSHYYYDCEKSSHTVVFASSGYGKSTLLQTIVLSLARQNTPNQVWFHLVDFGTNGLLPLKKLPHVVDIVTLEEEEKRQKMFVRINRSLAERKQLFKEKGATNLYQYQEKTSIQLPIIFIILDSYESLGIEDKRKDSIDETIVHLLRDGASLGIYLILSANRVGSIRLNMMSQFATKLFMYLHDESEIKQVLGREAIVALPIKGRGQVMLDRPTILQFYLPTNGQNESEIFEKMAEEITNIDQDWVGKRPEKILMVPERLTPKLFSQFVRNKEKDLVYLGLNKQTVEVESFAFFLGKQLGLFFTSNVQLQRMFSWWLSQMMDVEENVILIDVSGTLEQIKNEVTSYFSLHDVAKRSEKFTHFWDELWFTPKTRKIVVLNGLADFVEEMGLFSGEVGNFYGGMTQIVKENVSQILFDGSLQTQGFVDDFTFTRENNPNNKNSFYSLKDGKLEIIVVPVEEE